MLQNASLADYLARNMDVKTVTWEQMEPYLENARIKPDRTRLVLLDVHDLGVERIKKKLIRYGEEGAADFMALFNLPAGRGFEKKVIPYGIHGVFYDRDPLSHFAKGVAAILDNELWMPRSVMADIILGKRNPNRKREKHAAGLTTREIEILELITIGSTNETIADKLCISKNTVKTHIYNIFRKINVPNRLQAALWAVKNC